MGASAETLMKKIKQDSLISLDFICTKGMVDIYQHPVIKLYYAKINEILLYNGYAEGNLKSSRLQMAKLRYPTVCVSRETHPVLHTRPTIYIELTPSGLSTLASIYPGINLNHTLSIVPLESSNNTNDNINLKNIIKSFEEAVSELSIKNENLKNELKEERDRFKNTLIDVSIYVKNLKNDLDNLMNTSESIYENLLTLIREESNGDDNEI